MSAQRRRAEATLAAFVGVVILVVGGGAIWLVSTAMPVHENAAAVQSTEMAAHAERYAGPVEESRGRARALAVGANLPGVSVAVAVDGEIAWAEGFGWADAERTPVTPLTRFRLGALSKPLTAFAAALLFQRGRLDLDAPVQRYVPAYPKKQWTLTTRQLLGDVAGVHRPRGDNTWDSMPNQQCASLDEAVTLFAGDELKFEPGTQYHYSIYGWILVSAVVEGAAGEPFARFMHRQVFEPLGMERTLATEPDGADGVSSLNLQSIFGIPRGVEPERPAYSCLAGAGAFLSTPTDLVRLGSAMLKPGVLTAETIAAFQTPTRLASGASTTYALGWTVGHVQLAGRTVRLVSHRGSPQGGYASLLTFPDLGLAVAVTGNLNADAVNPFALQVAEAFVD